MGRNSKDQNQIREMSLKNLKPITNRKFKQSKTAHTKKENHMLKVCAISVTTFAGEKRVLTNANTLTDKCMQKACATHATPTSLKADELVETQN